MKHPAKTRRVIVLAIVTALLLAACGTGGETASPSQAETARDDAPVHEHTTDADDRDVAAAQGGDALAQADATLPAAELRVTLEQLLGQHALLAIEAMRAGHDGADHFEAAAGALQRNTDDLVGAVELAYGSDGADAFRTLWEDHIDFFVAYTVGVAEGDEDAQDEALTRLDQYREDFGNFLETATDGALEAGPVADLLQGHVNQLVSQIDAHADGNFSTASAQTREAHAHMFPTAAALAGAIAGQMPDRFPGGLDDGSTELRSALGELLGEHAQLAVQAMRSGVTGQDDFPAIAEALDGNTQDLTAAIEGIFGSEGAQAFQQMWSDHIDFFVAYTVGVAEGDEDAQEQALARLEQYRQDFSSFLNTATEGAIPADAVAEGLQVHVNQLVEQVEAFHAGDFETAFDVAYEAYGHMFMTAEALGGGITAFLGDQMPAGGVETGAGGSAGNL